MSYYCYEMSYSYSPGNVRVCVAWWDHRESWNFMDLVWRRMREQHSLRWSWGWGCDPDPLLAAWRWVYGMRWHASSLSSSCTWERKTKVQFTQRRVDYWRETRVIPGGIAGLSKHMQISKCAERCMPLNLGLHVKLLIKTTGLLWIYLILKSRQCWWPAIDHKHASQCVCLWACALCFPSTLSVLHHNRAVPLSAACRGLIVNEDTDSSQSQLCRGPTEWAQSPGVMDLMETGMALESGSES